MKQKLLFILGILFLLIMPIIFSLPYNVDLTNSNLSFFQYYDNETLGIDTPFWEDSGLPLVINATTFNGTEGYSARYPKGAYTQFWLPFTLFDTTYMGNMTYEFDLLQDSTTTAYNQQLRIWSGGNSTSRDYIEFRLGSAAMCANAWSVYNGTAGVCLNLTHSVYLSQWEHIKLTVNTITSSAQIQFTNYTDGTVSNWAVLNVNTAEHPTDTYMVYFASGITIGYAIDNLIVYKGNSPPLYTNISPSIINPYILNPINNTLYNNNNTIDFVYYINSYYNITNCSIYINNILNYTDTNISFNSLSSVLFNDSRLGIYKANYTYYSVFYTFINSENKVINNSEFIMHNYPTSSGSITGKIKYYYSDLATSEYSYTADGLIWTKLNASPVLNKLVTKIEFLGVDDFAPALVLEASNLTIKGYASNIKTYYFDNGLYNMSIKCYDTKMFFNQTGLYNFVVNTSKINNFFFSDNKTLINMSKDFLNFSYYFIGDNLNLSCSLSAYENISLNNSIVNYGLLNNKNTINNTGYAYTLSFPSYSVYQGIIYFNLYCKNSLNQSYNNSIYFNISDDINPYCSNLNDITIAQNTTYYFNSVCYDENFFLFNISCSNGLYYYADNINANSYLYNGSVNVNTDISCIYEYCDGHTDNTLGYYDIEKVSHKEIKFKFNSKNENVLYTQNDSIITYKAKKNKITFDINFKDKTDKKILYYKASENSYYIQSDKYAAWIVDLNSRTWFDLNDMNLKGSDIKVFEKEKGLYEITIYSDNQNFSFSSIGKINCVSEIMNIASYISGNIDILNFDLSNPMNMFLLIALIFIYIAMLFMAFNFNNFILGSFAFFTGILLAIMFYSVHIILTFVFFLLNTTLFLFMGKKMTS